MSKRIMKSLAMLLSFILVLGSINYTSTNVQAGNEEGTAVVSGGNVSGNDVSGGNGGTTGSYTVTVYPSALTYDWGQNYTAEVNGANRLEIGFTAAGGQVRYDLPITIDLAKCEEIVVNVKSQTGPVNLYTYNGQTQVDNYYYNTGSTSYTLTPKTEATIDSMNFQVGGTYEEGHGLVLDSLVFKMSGNGENVVYGTAPSDVTETGSYTVTVYPSALTHDWTKEGIEHELGSDNRLKLTFGVNNQDSRWDMPVTLDWSKVTGITIETSGHVGARPNVFFSTDNGNKVETFGNAEVASNKVEMTPAVTSGTVTEFGMQASGWSWVGDGTDSITIEAIVFTVSGNGENAVYGTAPSDVTETGSYTVTVYPSALTHDWTKEGIEHELGSDNRLKLTFGVNNQDSRWDMPVTLDWSKVTGITIETSGHVGARPNVFFSTDNGNKVETFGNAEVASNKVEMIPAVTSGTVTEFGMQASGWSWVGDGTDSITIEAIVFTVSGNGENAVYGTAPSDVTETGSYTVTVYPSALTYDWGQNYTAEVNSANRLEIGFTAAGGQVRYDLPITIDLAKCEEIVVNVKSQTGPVNLYTYNGQTQVDNYYYNTGSTSYTLTPKTEATIDSMNFQVGGTYEEGHGLVLDSLVFKMSGNGENAVYGTVPSDVNGGSTANVTPAATGDEDKRFTYKEGGLTYAYSSSDVTYEAKENEKVEVTLPSSWKEIRFALPENIDLAKCNSVTFAVSKQSVPMCFKLYTTDGNEIEDISQYSKTGTTKVTITGRDEIVSQVAIMIHSNDVSDSNTCVFDGVLFDMIKDEEIVETYTKTFNASELAKDWTNATTCELTDAGWTMTFAELNLEARFKLPETLNMENCQSINIKVSSQTGPVNFHLAADGTKLKSFWYNIDKTSYTLVPGITNKVSEILVQCGGESYTEGSAITIESVTFVMIGKEPLPTPEDDVYSAAYFEVEEASAGVTVTAAETVNDATKIEFTSEGSSVTFAIPDSVDVNHLVSVEVSVLETASAYSMRRSAAASPVTVSLLDANKNVIVASTDGSLNTNCNPDVKFIRLTANQDDVAIYLNNVKFNIDENAFEAIVLNGNFAREDVSMWGAAVYGSVDGVDTAITTHTSTTPIFGDVYTYGEISRRSSPYVCFAQNVTSRVTPGKTYSFNFWAKLSDDYADAPANQREITFSPYYLDANGTEQYGLIPDGAYKMSLPVGEWVNFSGTVTVPADSTGFVIRIVEQGTNYGQGDCVKGSYAVTGVVLEEYNASAAKNNTSTFNPAAQPIGYTVTYTAEDLVASTVAAQSETTEDGKIKVLFGQQYGEVKLKLPRSLDMSKICYITVKVSNQLNPIAVKLYKKGTQEWVSYFNNFASEYQVVPYMSEEIDTVGIMSLQHYGTGLDGITIESITFNLTEEPAPIPVSKDIVANGYFDGEDIDDWKAAFWGDGVTMTQAVSATPIFDNVYTYGAYSKRTSPYQCFAQDITDKVEQNEKYTFSFWARLSDDYKGAPEVMRVVQFAPYTVDKDGNPDYNPKLEGTYSQVLEPGVWTKFEGTYKVTNANEIGQVIIRILEQGTNYGQGDCVMGAYDVTGVVIEKFVPEPPSIDEDVPALKDAVTEVFGEDFIVGTALSGDEYDDIGVDMLVNKHFNAVTIGNELKPDALFGYSNSQHTKLQTVEFNGQELVVPTLDYSRAEAILNQILKWNEEHPDDPIKVRGHVLVWHSQTPEWFFRENYVVGQNADGSENYVTPEEMNLRLEWFIKTVLEHFTGENSKYKGLFYGWDVVNEAVGDGGNGYRTDKVSASESPSADTHSKNSSWWAVYQSNEFIIKAFQYANKYAPADVELYYNDYNDADSKKVVGIVALLKDVLAAEGTRIDAMGMQGHYNLFNPSNKSIEKAIRAYAEVVGAVQYTELDFKASGNISSEKGLQDEYKAQAERYHDIYLLLQKLNAEDGISITGFTVWGVIDSHSWLQSASDVGGGAEVAMDQCPLLFDSNYKVKPSYWAFVDYSKVDPDWVPEETSADDKTDKKDNTEDKNADKEADKDTSKEEGSVSTDSSTENEEESQTSDESAVSGKDVEIVKKTSIMPVVAVVAIVVVAAAAAVGVVMTKRKKK